MRVDLFDFELPPDRIALRPAAPRDAARLLVVRPGESLADARIRDLPDLLRPGDALDHVAGYCIGLDMTIRGPEERSLRKSLDSFTVLGPWMVTRDEFPKPTAIGLSITVNGEPRQDANTRDLVINVADLIAYASSFYTLMPGDVLLTGTPEGVGPVQPGDVMEAAIDHIGSMTVRVRAAEPARH